jgi:hypothetical protein
MSSLHKNVSTPVVSAVISAIDTTIKMMLIVVINVTNGRVSFGL